jgi:hypothetical protein
MKNFSVYTRDVSFFPKKSIFISREISRNIFSRIFSPRNFPTNFFRLKLKLSFPSREISLKIFFPNFFLKEISRLIFYDFY